MIRPRLFILTLSVFHQFIHNLFCSNRMLSCHFKARCVLHCFSVSSKTDIHAQLFQSGINGIEKSKRTTGSPCHLWVNLWRNLLTAVGHFTDKLSSSFLKIRSFEDPVKNKLDGLLRCPHWDRMKYMQSFKRLIILFLLLLLLLRYLFLFAVTFFYLNVSRNPLFVLFALSQLSPTSILVSHVFPVKQFGCELVYPCKFFYF